VKHIEGFVERYRPSLLLTHHCGDVNIDHRVVHDAVISACRPQPGYPVKELLFFEVPSSTEWRPAGSANAFCPNYFVDISMTLPKKLEALNAYAPELRPFPHPRSLKAVTALAHWRGATVGVEAAEAFILGRKLVA
jgi:LmbE family N-acetylglucosaminyl deacetylase